MRFWKPRAKRLAALVCALAMTASLLPTAVFADTGETVSVASSSVTEEEKTEEGQNTLSVPGEQPKEQPSPEPSESPAPEGTPTPSASPEGSPEPSESPEPVETPATTPSASPEGTPEPSESPEPVETPATTPVLNEVQTFAANAPRANDMIYNDAENGITVQLGSKVASDPQTVTFVVMVEAKEVARQQLTNVPKTAARLEVSADGWHYDAWGENATVTSAIDDYLMMFDNSDEHTVYINFAKPKQYDTIEITDEETDTYYGSFTWTKGNATNCASVRTVIIKVNGDEVYRERINTPSDLVTGGTSNQFGFNANLEKFNSDVKIKPLTLVRGSDVTFELTTRCPCGLPSCQCPGGTECEGKGCVEGNCPCGDCMPPEGTNVISTPYGVITYQPTGDDDILRRQLEVQIYLNGEKVHTENLQVQNYTSLTVKPAENAGIYFHPQAAGLNSFDIETELPASSWEPGSGQLTINGTSPDYNNVLKVYFWSFDEYTMLNVDRRGSDAKQYVNGYTISFMAYDPGMGEERLFTYPATSFSAAQGQAIPYGKPVILTADCETDYEVSQWGIDYVASTATLTGAEGERTGADPIQAAFGNTATLTVVGLAAADNVRVRIDDVRPVTPPTKEELEDPTEIFVGGAVTVDCVSNDSHTDQKYVLLPDTYKVSELQGDSVSGYYVTVTITDTQKYVDSFNKSWDGHTLGDGSDLEITLRWVVENQKSVWKPDGTATIKVKCETTEPGEPGKPTVDELNALLDVDLHCQTNGKHDMTVYGLIEGSYEVTNPENNACSVTVTADKYVAELSGAHTIVGENTATVELTYNDGWKLATGEDGTIKFTVKCVTPDAPGFDTVKDLLGDVKLVCNVHGVTGTYALTEERVVIDDVVGGGNGATVKVTVLGNGYLSDYNEKNSATIGEHTFAGSPTLTVELVYNNGYWKVAEKDADLAGNLVFALQCVAPDAPTDDDIADALAAMQVQVNCGSEMEHGAGTYALEPGTYGEPKLFAGDDTWHYTLQIMVEADAYLIYYNNDTALSLGYTHTLGNVKAQMVEITFTYDPANKAWNNDAETVSPVVFPVSCHATTPGEENKPSEELVQKALDGLLVKVLCNSEMDHGAGVYNLIDDSYDYQLLENTKYKSYTLQVMVEAAPYVDAYNADDKLTLGYTHTLDPEVKAQVAEITFTCGAGDVWTYDMGDANPVEFTVTCSATTPGEENKPSIELIQQALATLKVRLDCVADMGHGEGNYDLMDGSYHYELLENDKYDSYTLQVYVTADKYLAAYNADQALNLGYEHYLKVDTNAQVTEFTFTCGAGDVWSYSEATVNPVTFDVTCDAEHPNVPAAPDYDELAGLIGKIKVDCVTDAAHADGAYDLKQDYNVVVKGTVEDRAVATVYIPYNQYVAEYNKTNAGHVLAPEQTYGVVHLDYDKANGWYVKDESQLPVVFKVVCTPDLEDINKATGDAALTLDCVNGDKAASGHKALTMALQADTYSVSPVENTADGYTVTITVQQHESYLNAYNAKYTDYKHSYVGNDANDAQIVLVCKDGVWAAKDNDAAFFAVSCPAYTKPSTDDGKTDSGSGSNGNSNNNSNNANSNANNNNQVTVNNNVSSNAAAAPAASTVIPQTSDDMPIGLLVGLAIVAAGGLAALLALRKRRSDR